MPDDVQRLRRRRSRAPAADRPCSRDPAVPAEHRARRRRRSARARTRRDASSATKAAMSSLGHEADLLALGASRPWAARARQRARRTSGFVSSPTGNRGPLELLRRHPVEEVALVLAGVAAAGEPRRAVGVAHDARVVTGREVIRPLQRHATPAARANLTRSLQTMHGFGVRPAAYVVAERLDDRRVGTRRAR